MKRMISGKKRSVVEKPKVKAKVKTEAKNKES